MKFFHYLLKKGMPGAISRDLNIKYMAMKQLHPKDNEEHTLERIWNFYLTLNEEAIRAKDGKDKIIRLDVIKERYDKEGQPGYEVDGLIKPKNLLELYIDILYIETEVNETDGKLFLNTIKIFVKESKKFDLDFTKEDEALELKLSHISPQPIKLK